MNSKLVLLFLLAQSSISFAGNESSEITAAPSEAFEKKAIEHNRKQRLLGKKESQQDPTDSSAKTERVSVIRPYSEYEKAESLFFTFVALWDSSPVKEALLRYLPADMKAYVTVSSPTELSAASQWVRSIDNSSRSTAVYLDGKGGNPFWARDNMSIPIYVQAKDGSETLGLVDSYYYHSYEPDTVLANWFNTVLVHNPYYFEGGNFLADRLGNCFVVNNARVAITPDDAFKKNFGCRTLTRLAHLQGIGHVDERVKFLADGIAVTDTPEYKPILQSKGFTVTMLPTLYPIYKMRTYANTLLVNGTIFMPTFGIEEDEVAKKVYTDMGFKVVTAKSNRLSDMGMGSIHCITMTYPPAALKIQ